MHPEDPIADAVASIATAIKEDDHAGPERVGLPALELLETFLRNQARTADALERIAAALEAPEPK